MAIGRPAAVSGFEMSEPPELLAQVSYDLPGANPFQESYLQWLLDTTPELLPVRDFYPSVTSLCSLGREIPVSLGGGRNGYIDNLLVTNTGHLVVVETKLHRNPEGIREVVAQTFEYGQAINAMTFLDLEAALRRGMKGGNELRLGETIAGRARARQADGSFRGLMDDFEDRLVANIRRGEVLYLIVADGIHASVERLAIWLNEIGGSGPHRFGLVELRSYRSSDGRAVIIPRSLLRTREVARHVVVIEPRVPDLDVSAKVEQRVSTESGSVSITTRAVRLPGPSLNRDRLIEELRSRSPDVLDVALGLLDAIDERRFDSRALTTELQFGLADFEGEGAFIPIIKLTTSGAMSEIPSRVMNLLTDGALSEFKQSMREAAPFFSESDVPDRKRNFGRLQRYELLRGKAGEVARAMDIARDAIVEALSRKDSA